MKIYEDIHKDIVGYLSKNGAHATMVGKIVNLGGTPDQDEKSATEMADYVVKLIKNAHDFNKNNVKKTRKQVR